MEAISEIESLIKESNEILWVIINKRTGSVRPFVAKAAERGVEIRSISLTSYIPSLDVRREIIKEDELKIVKAESIGKAIVADETEFDVYLWLTEKGVFISFPLMDGTFDYTGFLSYDPSAINFGRDIFLYYWGKSNIIPNNELVKRHLEYIRKHGYEINFK
jgi:predicted transcriptional regulator